MKSARGQEPALVPPAGFEPAISTLKGWRPGPLDDGGLRRTYYSRERRKKKGETAAGRLRRRLSLRFSVVSRCLDALSKHAIMALPARRCGAREDAPLVPVREPAPFVRSMLQDATTWRHHASTESAYPRPGAHDRCGSGCIGEPDDQPSRCRVQAPAGGCARPAGRNLRDPE